MASKDMILVKFSDKMDKRRLLSIHGIDHKQFRSLRAGQAVKITVDAYEHEPDLYIPMKEDK